MHRRAAILANIVLSVESAAPFALRKLQSSDCCCKDFCPSLKDSLSDSQVRKLYGPDPMLKWKILAAVATQVFMAWVVSGMHWAWVVALAYLVGGSINHSMTLGMHEVSHNLAFSSPKLNKWFGLFTNLPLGIPSFVSFKRYHMEHHNYQVRPLPCRCN